MMFFPGCASVKPQGRGVVLILGCEKNPIGSILCPIVGALAAGNAIVARVPPSRPKCEKVLTAFFKHFMDDRYSVVLPAGSASVTTLSGLAFDAVCFTGGEDEAKEVSKAASANLCPLLLNLDRGAFLVVDSTANLEAAAATPASGTLTELGIPAAWGRVMSWRRVGYWGRFELARCRKEAG